MTRRAEGLFARKGQKLSHERRRAVGVLADLHQVAVFHIRHVVPHQQKVTVAVDRRQQVVEVMRHAAGELADGLHFLGLDELRLKRLELGRVGEHRQNRGGSVEDRAGEGHLEKNLLTFGLAARDLGAAERTAFGGVLQAFRDRDGRAPRSDRRSPRRERTLAQKLAGGLVRVGEGATGLETREGDRQVLEEMIGDQAGYLRAAQRIEEDVARAADIRENDGPHGLTGGRQHMHPVGTERRIDHDVGKGLGPIG